MARRRRPPWWEVPPQGYLEVESRNSPTSPRALRATARAAAKAGMSWDPGNLLPVQHFVGSQERARLVFQARRELPRVTAVASQVMLVDSRLTQAEEVLQQAISHRSVVAAAALGRATAEPATTKPPARPAVLGPWSEAAILTLTAGGQAVLAYTAARDASIGPLAVGLLAGTAAGGSIVAAQLAARGLHRLGATDEGAADSRRRRQLEVGVVSGALACGAILTTAVGQLESTAGPPALGLALLGLATAASYAAAPRGDEAGDISRWRSATGWLRQRRRQRRGRRSLRVARAREAAAQAAVHQLREELAVLIPQLFAAEQSALLFWRYQVAIGDATQHGFAQQLAAYSTRGSRGVWRPISDWWRGTSPAPSGAGEAIASIGEDQPDWGDQVARVTTAAKRVLVRRGLLDITHGLRLPFLHGAPAFDHNGGRPAARSNPDPLRSDDTTYRPDSPA